MNRPSPTDRVRSALLTLLAAILFLTPALAQDEEPATPTAATVGTAEGVDAPQSATSAAPQPAASGEIDHAAEAECSVGEAICVDESHARRCRIAHDTPAWTEYECFEGQTCDGGTCKSSMLSNILIVSLSMLGLAFIWIIISYARGLRGSPRELYMLFAMKVIEYTAYGAMQMTFVLFLSDLVGLGDIAAGAYISAWSVGITIVTITVGAVVDAIGIKKTLLIGTTGLLVARFFLPLTTNIWAVTILGFMPMALGTAIMAPVISVGIKRYTTTEGAALGFGMFYTLMNVGWAAGGWLFDFMRERFGESGHALVPVIHVEMHTYQLIFEVAFLLTLPIFALVLMMRERVEMTDDRGIVIGSKKERGSGLAAGIEAIKEASLKTYNIMNEVFREKSFWTFMFMLATLIGVRLVFLHFHYTFPKYGIRVLGEGVKIGSIYGVLNPVVIVFLVPMVAALTKKVSSYKMMMIGTFLSAAAVFIVTFPEATFSFMEHGWMAELVYDRWLHVPTADRRPLYMGLILFIFVFTIGEAFWSPRLMQFTAEIAPKGREGTYIALAMLPMFLAKFVAGPMSGWLVSTYTPIDANGVVGDTTHHWMVWVWIGGMAITSPIFLVVFSKLFRKAEQTQIEARAAE